MKAPMMKLALAVALVAAFGCEKKDDKTTNTATQTAAQTAGEEPGIKADKGVDVEKKVIKFGALNDESGPAVTIGKPYAAGKRIVVAEANAEGSDLLPEGWSVELVERDHGYNPQKSVQAYEEIKGDVLAIVTGFGTPPTLPLVPKLKQDNMVVMPASLSSKMAENEFTPPFGPAYFFEVMRALDWAVEDAGGADKVKAGIIYQNDDYGQDGIHGFEMAAEKLGVEVVAKQAVKPGQPDVTAAVKALQDGGANYVILSVLPSATGPIVGTAAQLKYMPKWIGNTPAWVDAFYSHDKLPSAVFANFHIVSGVPFWGEESEGMKAFLAAYEKHGEGVTKDWYVLLSYVQGKMALEVAKQAIEAGDITREGFLKQLHSLDAYTANGMSPPLNFTKTPYVVGTKTRILKPDFENKTFTVVADWAAPTAYEAPAE